MPSGIDESSPEIAFCCPRCKGELQMERERLSCSKCDLHYPVRDGIACFSEPSTYYGEIRREQMSQLLRDADEFGYHEGLKRHLTDPFVHTYALDETRARWAELLPLGTGTRFLDVGCGWGTNAASVARSGSEVIALDATYERVKFVDIRASQERLNGVVPVLGSAVELPIPDASVDVVAFNGVLEWLGAIDKSKDPTMFQRQALREARRVLKPGGCLYVGIENRYSLRYFLGAHDDHSFIRFTSLLPRPLAHLYCRIRKGERYYTYTHSLATYRRLLTEGGFGDVKVYYPWPTYRNPEVIVPLTAASVIEHCDAQIREGSWRQQIYLRLLRALTRVEGRGRFCHSFCFVARRNGSPVREGGSFPR